MMVIVARDSFEIGEQLCLCPNDWSCAQNISLYADVVMHTSHPYRFHISFCQTLGTSTKVQCAVIAIGGSKDTISHR